MSNYTYDELYNITMDLKEHPAFKIFAEMCKEEFDICLTSNLTQACLNDKNSATAFIAAKLQLFHRILTMEEWLPDDYLAKVKQEVELRKEQNDDGA